MKTMVFTENMEDAYSGSSHMDQALRTVETNEVANTPQKVGDFE